MTSTADITTNSNAAILELNSSNAADGTPTMTTTPTRQINTLAIGVRNPMIRARPAIATDAAAIVATYAGA